ncbi:unconventional myosin-XV-like [Actinia tenebrosa]|uniref:Unconventional myosin-XV-like n=1 Tax=Actinia tenebrosa TaxID=6105 RepID=A0A6P8IXV5_ACTTE|nr:unconventional myosin-XV-like [Actinia tenebrosa]
MAAKHAAFVDKPGFERILEENASLHGEVRILRENLEEERRKNGQLLGTFKTRQNEDFKNLAHAKKLSETLAEENAQLKAEIKSSNQGRHGSNFGGEFLKELENFGQKFEILHRDLMNSNLMKNLKGKHVINQDDIRALKNNFEKTITELVSIRNLLTNKKDSVPNGVLLTTARQGSKTNGIPSNLLSGNRTSSIEDLIHLNGPVTENAILDILHKRLSNGQSITKLGPVLLSVNSLNSTQFQALSSDTLCLDSCVKEVMDRLSERGIPQVFVLSGSSGSGKTYVSQVLNKKILEQGDKGLVSDICKHFLASVTVLQSFSLAKTTLNSNSSRVGHLYEFYFTDGYVSKTKIQCYSLDYTRVTSPLSGERAFHIFYEMLNGITQEERAKLHLQGYSCHNLHYLSGCPLPTEEEELKMRTTFEKWRGGLSTLGIPFTDVLRILAAILLLGNVQFVEGEGLELDVKGNNEIKAVAALLGVSGVSLYRGLTTKTKNLRGQVFRSLCEPTVANQHRDSLAMALYSRTLAAIVRRVNSFKRPTSSAVTSTSASGEAGLSPGSPGKKAAMTNGGILSTNHEGSPTLSPVLSSFNGLLSIPKGTTGLVAVMDMFGFENRNNVNQLEQICINLCSETIQHFYNTHIFKSSEEYCREDDIHLDADYVDNAACIELLTCQRAGILTLLDKESLFIRGTYLSFLQKVREQHQESECFFDPEPENPCFAVTHHADNVVYDARNLIHINRDTIPDDIVCVFSRQNCNFGFATHLFTSDLKSPQGQTAAPKGVLHRVSPTHTPELNRSPGNYEQSQTTFSQDFQGKLDSLLKTLVQAQPMFLRCIKTNLHQEPNVFDRRVVSQQLRALQVFETLRLLQSEFAHHSRFPTFIQKYGFLSSRPLGEREETEPEDCEAILESHLRKVHKDKAGMLSNSWVLGKKYLFYSDIMKQELDRQRDSRKSSAVVTIQAFVRGWLCRKQWITLKRSLEMQKKARLQSRTNHKHGSSRHIVPADHELSVDTKTAEQICCLHGLDMETPPPLPRSRPYTVMGNMKMGFPQTRIMKQDLLGGDGEVLLRKGEHVKVVSAARKRGFLLVEQRSGSNIQVPFQITELKVSPNPSPR